MLKDMLKDKDIDKIGYIGFFEQYLKNKIDEINIEDLHKLKNILKMEAYSNKFNTLKTIRYADAIYQLEQQILKISKGL